MVTTVEPQHRPRPPRRATVGALLRAGLAATALVAVYYALPLTGRFDVPAAAVLAIGMSVFAVIIVRQFRAIIRADHPALRTVESLFTSIPLFLVVFATVYLLLDTSTTGAFSEPLTKTGALYYTVTVFATVGFGDIAPRTELTRVVTMLQMLADLFIIGLAVRVLVGAMNENLSRRRRAVRQDR